MRLKKGERKRRREIHFEKILDKKWRYANFGQFQNDKLFFMQLTCGSIAESVILHNVKMPICDHSW